MNSTTVLLVVLAAVVVVLALQLPALGRLQRTVADLADALDIHLNDLRDRLGPTLEEIDSHLEHESLRA